MRSAAVMEIYRPHPTRRSKSRMLSIVLLAHTIWLGNAIWLANPARCDDTPAPDAQQTVEYSIIVTGNELLSGVYADGHTLFLTKTLRPLGVHCVGSLSVDDQDEAIRQAIQFSLRRSQLVIITGGLGPTESDITRDVVSAFTNVGLQEQPEVLKQLAKRFNTPREALRANLRRQTRVPVKGTYLPNKTGTAVGLVFEHGDQVIVALPGPPRELQPMVRDHLIPYLAKTFGVHTLGTSTTVRFVGVGQSQIDEVLRDRVRLPADVMQTSQFKAGRVDFTFSLPANTPASRQRLKQLCETLHQHLGDHIYADDSETTLEEATVQSFHARGHTVTLIEFASGGGVAAGFTQVPHGRNVLAGSLAATTPNQMQHMLQIAKNRWPSNAPTEQLNRIADVARERMQSDWTVVVAPPDSSSTDRVPQVRVLITTPTGARLERSWSWQGDSPPSRTKLTTQVFDYLRTLHD